jgi:hypothetical protein
MNKILGFLENFGAKGLVLLVGIFSFSQAKAVEQPLYLTTLPVEDFEAALQAGDVLRARDISAFKAFIENKYQVGGLRTDGLVSIIQTNDLQDYQALNRESAELAGKASPTCIC